jgi:hypothetical protein
MNTSQALRTRPCLGQLLSRTANAILAREQLPRSPGVTVEDEVSLCAGAALVSEAARRTLPSCELALLNREMVAHGRERILRRAEEFGIHPAFVELVVIKNDLCTDWERRARMALFLSRAIYYYAPG